MSNFIQAIGIENILLVLVGTTFLLLIACIIAITKIVKLNQKYKNFMIKLGKGKNIEEDLENYLYRVERVEKQNTEITTFVKSLETDLEKCIQKVGMVRYNAFKDTGSNLSFALALLDEKNNGVVLNGIYSREMSNIYAKPVENGKSTYTVSEEEQEAIQKAVESKNIYKIK